MVGSCKYISKHVQTVDNGWSSSLGLGWELITTHREQKQNGTKCYTGPRTWTLVKAVLNIRVP
jgi:hypothetical protein